MSAEARVPPSATLPADLVERPRRVRQSYVGIVALSRWRGAADRSSAPSKGRRASKTFSYRLAAIAQSDERTERRVAKLDEQLATLREAIQANSQALGSLTREAETRSALAA